MATLDMESGETTSTLQQGVSIDEKQDITHFAVHPSGKEVATISGKGVVLSRWRVSSGSIEQNDQQPNNSGDNEAGQLSWTCSRSWKTMHTATVVAMAYDASGKLVATGENVVMQSLGRSSWILHAQLSWIRWARSWREISPRPFGRTARCLL